MAKRTQFSVTVSQFSESGLLVCFPNRISPAINSAVHRLVRRIRSLSLPGVIDLVPAYATLLVAFDPDFTTHVELIETLVPLFDEEMGGDYTAPPAGRTHLVPVQYGGDVGPDLQDVARIHGLSADEVIRLHTGREYGVSFLGFLPGFAYLGKLPPRLASPRLATPRIRVEAGSVGIAGAQTAVYPLTSPGGWRIIGRSSLPVWDPLTDPPVRFTPDDTIRFVQSAYEPGIPAFSAEPVSPTLPALEVLSAPGFTTVQDLGRPGMGHLGVARGGVFDLYAARRANALVGNSPDSAVLEMTWNGPTLRALRNFTIALDGAELECRVDGAVLPNRLSWFVRRGAELRFSRTHPGRGGVRGYLAVSGGIDVPVLLGSRSTSLQAQFGGYQGRALKVGDILGIIADAQDPGLVAGKYWLGPTIEVPEKSVLLRFLPYEGRGNAPAAAQKAFAVRTFVLTERADRMGYRFAPEEDAPLATKPGELLSFGVVRGAIQLPPDGKPVILNVDQQTTGGYPILGFVIQADWPVLAQLAPGVRVRFELVNMDEANRERRRAVQSLENGYRLLGR